MRLAWKTRTTAGGVSFVEVQTRHASAVIPIISFVLMLLMDEGDEQLPIKQP